MAVDAAYRVASSFPAVERVKQYVSSMLVCHNFVVTLKMPKLVEHVAFDSNLFKLK
jgi:hypothetical protein